MASNPVSVPLPGNLYGNFTVVVITDSSNVVQECSGETNNVLVSAAPLQIRAAVYPAVLATQVTAPAAARPAASLPTISATA